MNEKVSVKEWVGTRVGVGPKDGTSRSSRSKRRTRPVYREIEIRILSKVRGHFFRDGETRRVLSRPREGREDTKEG